MILVYTENKSNRLFFICNQLLKHVLGYEFHISSNLEKCLNSEVPLICYAKKYVGKGLHIVPNGLLEETGVHRKMPEVSEWDGMPIFFQTNGGDLPFDIFSAAFYLISRYEEYDDVDPDKHGRFKAENSLAYKNGFLERPIVDEWTMALEKMLEETYPKEEHDKPNFIVTPTIDVDHVFAIQNKGFFPPLFKALGALFKGNKSRALYILRVLFHQSKDPFFNLGKMEYLHHACYRTCIFFCHCGASGKYDKHTLFPSIRYFIKRRSVSKSILLGLHPSYRASKSLLLFKLEKWIFKKSIKDNVTDVRFHYLRFTVPDGYDMLVHQNVRHDWSMIYSNYCGFRAGTSFPFHFFDINKDKLYKLTIHPTAVMDKTLKQNMGLNIEESLEYIEKMAKRVEAVNGRFVTLFHNDHLTDAFDEWSGWTSMYKKMLKMFFATKRQEDEDEI